MKKPTILILGNEANYFIAKPNFEKKILERTANFISTSNFSPFGFSKKFSVHYNANSFDQKYDQFKKDHPQGCFRKFLDALSEAAGEHGCEFILVDAAEPRDLKTYWSIDGQLQLLVANKDF